MSYSDAIYKPRLEEAIEYQDFVCMELHQRGLVMQNMGSKKYQYSKGENLLGMEIKHDLRLHGEDGKPPTCNVYIETAEKSNPGNPGFARSGIWRADNSWLYAIGDYSILYVFPKRWLQRVHGQRPTWITQRENATSKGFTFSEARASDLAALVVRFMEATRS